MNITATYSPEDNKLRLSASSRLDAETYARVKSAGFSWAPRQEIFVAPAWSPQREDLALELAGEIDDEDTSLVDRAEQRAERFEEYSDKREADAKRAADGVARIADGIPLGQPILVGHHSERRARKDAERIENGMRQAVRMWDTAAYWERRAEGAIRAAKYKERPDVRARRIKTIEAEQRKWQRANKDSETCLAMWLTLEKLANDPEKQLAQARLIAGRTEAGGLYVVRQGDDTTSWWSAYDVLQPDETRYKACPSRTVADVIEAARRVYPKNIAYRARWIAHCANRLAYERAMLGETGGLAADRTKPEKGGAVRCWVFRSGWSYIQQVNKASVSVLDNWGNGGRTFRRLVPFDKLAAVMTAAEVTQALAEGRIHEHFAGGAIAVGFYLTEREPTREAAEPATPETAPGTPDERTEPDSAPNAEARARALWTEQGIPTEQQDGMVADITAKAQPGAQVGPFTLPAAETIDAMRAALKAGVQVHSVAQLFTTPDAIAARVVEFACIEPHHRVLEPSAGTGALLRAIGPGPDKVAVERDTKLAEYLATHSGCSGLRVYADDFLAIDGPDNYPGSQSLAPGRFDRVVMNPPFHNASDIRHIRHALRFLKPGGRLVAICANGPRQRAQLFPLASHWEELPAGTFAGTDVRAVLLAIDNPDRALAQPNLFDTATA